MKAIILAALAAATLATVPLSTASAQGYYWHGPGYYGGHYYHRYWGDGAGVGLGLGAGLLAGAVIAGAASAPGPVAAGPGVYSYPPNTRLGYCERNLPGFDVRNGSYIAPNGRRAACP